MIVIRKQDRKFLSTAAMSEPVQGLPHWAYPGIYVPPAPAARLLSRGLITAVCDRYVVTDLGRAVLVRDGESFR